MTMQDIENGAEQVRMMGHHSANLCVSVDDAFNLGLENRQQLTVKGVKLLIIVSSVPGPSRMDWN